MILLLPTLAALIWCVYQITSAPVVEPCDTTDCGCRWGSLDHRGEA